MTHATVLVHDLAGRPDPVGWAPTAAPARCAICVRDVDASMPAAKALGSNFTDPTLWGAPESDRVCAGCTWCCAGRPPHTIRGWTILATPGHLLPASAEKAWSIVKNRPGLCVTNRSDPRAVADVLLDPPPGPWVCTVAVSGQKHTLPYTRVNHGRDSWCVRMETAHVTSSPAAFRTILAAAARLRAAGHRAEDITAGTPTHAAIKTTANLTAWRTLAEMLAGYECSGALALALWCLTKTTIPHYQEIPLP